MGEHPGAGSSRQVGGDVLAPGRSLRSIVFTDMVGSTAMRAQFGDVKADAARRDHDAILGSIVHEAGGAVVKGTGDGILAVFTSAASALEATALMQRAMVRRNLASEHAIEIRVGAATGDVVVEAGDVYGTAVVEAARLCEIARGGAILATDLTVQLAQSGAAVDVGESELHQLKGLSAPVRVHEVLWQRLRDSPVPLPSLLKPRPDESKFVSRSGELAELSDVWNGVAAGAAATALIGGEPGAGKTRLVSELARRVHGDGAVVLIGQCEMEEGYPFRPFVEALRHHLDALTSAGPVDGKAALGRNPGELVRLVPELASLVPGLPAATRSDPATEEYRLYQAVSSWLASISRTRPVLFVIDDLHWASPATASMLRHLVSSDVLTSVMFVATHRTEDIRGVSPVRGLLAYLTRASRAFVELTLEGIDQHAVLELMHGTEIGDQPGALDVARRIVERSDGNAFFVTELVRTLALLPAGHALEIDELFASLPNRLADVIEQRVALLSSEGRTLLEAAAVCGQRFDLTGLRAALGWRQDVLLERLDEVVDADLVVDADGPRMIWTFRHALIRDAVLAEMTTARRLRVHVAIASALGDDLEAGRPVDIELLAHHSAEAAASGLDVDSAIHHCHVAAQRAVEQLASGDAAAWYERAIDLLDRAGSSDPELRFELFFGHGVAQKRIGDPAGRENLLGRAVDAAREAGGGERLAQAILAATGLAFSTLLDVDDRLVALIDEALAAVQHEGVRARLLAAKALELAWADDDHIRFELSDAAVALARRHGDDTVLMAVLGQRQIATWTPASLADRYAETSELMDLARASGDPFQLALAMRMRLHPLIESTEIREARALMIEAQQLAADLGQPEIDRYLVHGEVQLAIIGGDLDAAAAIAVGSLKRCMEQNDMSGLMTVGGTFVEIRRMQGRFNDVISNLDLAAEQHADTNNRHMEARLRHQVGQVSQARELYERIQSDGIEGIRLDTAAGPKWLDFGYLCARFDDVVNAPAIITCLEPYASTMFAPMVPYPVCAHMLGMLHAVLGEDETALEYWAAAGRIFTRIEAPFFQDETRLEEARLRLRRSGPGDVEEAMQLLDQVERRAKERRFGYIERSALALRDEFAVT